MAYTDVGMGTTQPIDWSNETYQKAAKELKASMNNMSAADAQRIYAEKKAAFGFTDEDFNKYSAPTANTTVWGDGFVDYGTTAAAKQAGYNYAAEGQTDEQRAFRDHAYNGNNDAAVATERGISWLKANGFGAKPGDAERALSLWNGGIGTNFTVADYNRAMGIVPQTTPVDQAPVAQPTGYSNTAAPPQLNFNLNDIQQAKSWTVDPKTQTVAGQLESILASDSPLLVQARTRALQRMNGSGTLNSTMASSAADSAMYDAALDIAAPDARTYADAGRFNVDNENQFAREGNAFTRQGVMADFNLRANDWAAGREADRTAIRDERLNAYTLARDRINNDFTMSLEDKRNAFQTLRDQAQNDFTLSVEDKRNLFTTQRDATANTNETNRIAAANKAASDDAAKQRIYNAKDAFATNLTKITMNTELEEGPRRTAILNLRDSYNAIIKTSAEELGWKYEDWDIEGDTEDTTSSSTSTTPSTSGAPKEGDTRFGANGQPEIFAGGIWQVVTGL
jgi:hypothetical protein